MKKLTIGIAWDDVIAPLNDIAIELHNRNTGSNDTIDILKSWETAETVLWNIYKTTELYHKQRPTDEAIEAIHKLEKFGEIFIATTPFPEIYPIRKEQVHKFFPEIHDDHIIIGPGKNELKFDFLLDANMATCIASKAKHPVLMEKPWNKSFCQEQHPRIVKVSNITQFYKLVVNSLWMRNLERSE